MRLMKSCLYCCQEMSSASGFVLSVGVATLTVVTFTAGAALGAVLRVLRVLLVAVADLTGIEL